MKRLNVILFIFVVAIAGCEDQKILEGTENISQIELNVFGLNDLQGSGWYESWILWNREMGQGTDIDTTSLGILERQTDGSYRLATDVTLGFLQAGLMILVTIEDDDTVANEEPSIYEVIGAKIAANSGIFSLGNEEVLDFSFEVAQGRYILDTPTESPPSQNPFSGIWFVNPDTIIEDILDDDGNIVDQDTTIEFLPGLDLPDLPEGWLYEGFVEVGGQTLSIGTFTKSSAGDDSSTYNGAETAYPFPGEDFINNPPSGLSFPVDLRGAHCFVTLTPAYPEGSVVPYVVTVYETQISSIALPQQVYFMENTSDTFPAGDIHIDVSIYK
jgi:hypothetical protein